MKLPGLFPEQHWVPASGVAFTLDGWNGVHAGLNEALEKLSDDKVDASGMDAYTQQITKVGGVGMPCPHHCLHLSPPLPPPPHTHTHTMVMLQ